MSEELNNTLKVRGATHGNFTDNSEVSKRLRSIVLDSLEVNCEEQIPSYVIEAIFMICHKLARIACGDPLYKDHWVDIAGYATLVAERIALKNSKN